MYKLLLLFYMVFISNQLFIYIQEFVEVDIINSKVHRGAPRSRFLKWM